MGISLGRGGERESGAEIILACRTRGGVFHPSAAGPRSNMATGKKKKIEASKGSNPYGLHPKRGGKKA